MLGWALTLSLLVQPTMLCTRVILFIYSIVPHLVYLNDLRHIYAIIHIYLLDDYDLKKKKLTFIIAKVNNILLKIIY